MAILNMTEAAKRAGISRTTLWRKVKAGVLSATTSPDGSPGIDEAELTRVFHSETVEQPERDAGKQDGTEVERLKTENSHLRELIEHKNIIIGMQERELRKLEHRPPVEPEKKRGFWATLLRLKG